MIRVTIELLPLGIEEEKRHIGTMIIFNDGTGSRTRGSYKYRISKQGHPLSIWKEGEVDDFARTKLGPWDLLFLVLKHAVGKRDKSRKAE
jgi:hypothetical protein